LKYFQMAGNPVNRGGEWIFKAAIGGSLSVKLDNRLICFSLPPTVVVADWVGANEVTVPCGVLP
jgi:hypothetical protein